MITKNEKETFFTSFLLRDKAFDWIKGQLGGDKNNNILLKRAFIKNVESNSNSQENEESEQEFSFIDEAQYVMFRNYI